MTQSACMMRRLVVPMFGHARSLYFCLPGVPTLTSILFGILLMMLHAGH